MDHTSTLDSIERIGAFTPAVEPVIGQEFHLFSLLPTELQREIWRFSNWRSLGLLECWYELLLANENLYKELTYPQFDL
jgi:hypothetical protein